MTGKQGFHLPSLDGIRAVAVLLVFLSHAGLGHVIPGGLGVTIFFFLSGYLITTLLRKEHERYGAIDLKAFYLRRIYRIMPPLYFVLILILAASLAGVVEWKPRPMDVLAQVLQFTNYYVLIRPDTNFPPFAGVFWSLAVEEHFYLLLPVTLIWCLRRWPNPTIAKVFLGVCVVVLAWRLFLVYGFHVSERRTYLATDTRLDSLLYGCVMALWGNPALDPPPRPFRTAPLQVGAALCALVLLALTLLQRGTEFRETWRYTLQGIALFPVFWLSLAHPDWPPFRLLNWKWVRGLGVVSYSFYLTHLFWLDLVSTALDSSKTVSGIIAFAVTVLFSIFMHQYIETPFATLRNNLVTRQAPPPRGGDEPNVI